jgi:hypothetical protein
MKRQSLAILGGLLTFAIIACNQATPSTQTPAVLGMLELTVSNGMVGQSKFIPAKLGTQAILNESQLVFTPSAVAVFFAETNAPRNFDYVSRNFTITNNTGATINNLTLVALAKTGNIGGTAIKTATAFNGSTTDATTAQLARPTHTMIASGGGAVVDDLVDVSRASFQALTASEATAIQNDSSFASQGLTGTVLEYGFAATNSAATSRSITNNSSGKVSIAMRFPKPATATNTYNFVMTFAVTAESANRVTRSPEDTTAKANARATALGATQKVLIDDPTIITTPPTGYTVQSNVKIGTGASQTLLKNPAKLVIARVYAAGVVSTTGSVYDSDFVEIFNAGEFSATLASKSLQYGGNSAEIAATATNLKDVTELGVVSPGGYKLVTVTNTTPVSPPSDTASAWGINFSMGLGGKVALVNSTTALNCGGSTACSNAQNNSILDLLGYSTATSTKFEGTQLTLTAGVGNDNQNPNLAFTRKNKGCTDSDNNANDFDKENITNTSARNSSSPVFVCP